MAIPRIGGSGIGFTNAGLATTGGVNVGFTNAVTLTAGETFIIPAGTYMVHPGPYTYLQWLDPASGLWKTMNTAATVPHAIDSDGANFRLANQTGCVVGALITTGGAGGPNGIGATTASLTITSSGGPTFSPIVGGALSTSGAPALLTTGSGYLFPPIVIIDAPPAGGIQATAFATLSGGFLAASSPITFINQGAGYTSVPNITLVNDPRDTVGAGASVTGGALTGSGVLTGLLVTNHGNSFTASGAAPAITIVTGGAGWTTLPAATAIMNWCLTSGISGVSGGTVFTVSPVFTSGTTSAYYLTYNMTAPGVGSAPNAGSLVIGNPDYDIKLTLPRPARLTVVVSGALVGTGANGFVLEDAGLGIQRVPSLFGNVATSGTATQFQASTSGVLGGSPSPHDTSVLQRI